jgi:hypothetical protein
VPQARMYRTPWVLDQHGNLWREIWQGGPDGPLPLDPPVEPRPPGRCYEPRPSAGPRPKLVPVPTV